MTACVTSHNTAKPVHLQSLLLLRQLQFHLFLACDTAPFDHDCWLLCDGVLEKLTNNNQ